jgi:hypothetical protein
MVVRERGKKRIGSQEDGPPTLFHRAVAGMT